MPEIYTALDGERKPVTQASPNAMAVYRALMAAMEAERALDKAQADMPAYRPTSADIDHYGPELSAFNAAVNEFGYLMGIRD